MPASAKEVSVLAWQTPELLLEFYRYGPGRHALIPRHAHAEYQIGLCLDHPGMYGYRGSTHDLPVGSVSVLHPQEPHVTGSGRTLVRAEVPELELTRYAIDVRSLSHGTGTFTRTYARHDAMPSHLAAKIRAEAAG